MTGFFSKNKLFKYSSSSLPQRLSWPEKSKTNTKADFEKKKLIVDKSVIDFEPQCHNEDGRTERGQI